jgi:hypothetical protein
MMTNTIIGAQRRHRRRSRHHRAAQPRIMSLQ